MINVISKIDNKTIADFVKEIEKIDLDVNCIRNGSKNRQSKWIKYGSNLCPLEPLHGEDFIRHKIINNLNRYVEEPTSRLDTFFHKMYEQNRLQQLGFITYLKGNNSKSQRAQDF